MRFKRSSIDLTVPLRIDFQIFEILFCFWKQKKRESLKNLFKIKKTIFFIIFVCEIT